MFLSSWIILSGDESNPLYNQKITISCIIIILIIIFYKIHNSKPSKNVYLVNFACFKPKNSQQLTREDTIKRTIQYIGQTSFTEETLQVLRKMTKSSGLGDCTYVPETLLKDPIDASLAGARQDAEAALFGAVDTLLSLTRVDVRNIGVLVVNSSVFSPVPSLASIIVHKYKFKDDVKGYCLSGMGCSAGIVAIDLAIQLLQVHPNTYAMVVSTDVLGQSYYIGNDPSKLPMNIVMRVGGAAVLLSNHSSDHPPSLSNKYELVHTLRTNTSSSDNSYHCAIQEEDSQGHIGITMSKDLILSAVRNTFKAHLLALGPRILPLFERLKFLINYIAIQMNKFIHLSTTIKPYVPNFGISVNHFIPHVGIKYVLEFMERTFKVNVEAARMTLYRFGNASSSTIWYELSYVEAKGRVKMGDRVWLMGFGTGVKANSLILKALKDVDHHEEHNPWSQEIDNFPIEL